MLTAPDYGTEAVTVVEGYGDAANNGLRIFELGLAVAGKIDDYLVSRRNQGPRQCTHHVGQPAGLGKWHTFGSSKNYVHQATPLKCRPRLPPAQAMIGRQITAYSAQSNSQDELASLNAGKKEGQCDKNRCLGEALRQAQARAAFSGRFGSGYAHRGRAGRYFAEHDSGNRSWARCSHILTGKESEAADRHRTRSGAGGAVAHELRPDAERGDHRGRRPGHRFPHFVRTEARQYASRHESPA